ncbi:MAG: diguanylate cyclase [Azoarcus sp.]|nr:diguanylate cyclase [Azoarcus sp.]
MQTNHQLSLGSVLDLLLDAICVVGTDGRFVLVGGACERIFGYTPDEMIGRPVLDFVYEEDRERTLQSISDVLTGEFLPYFENRYVRKDGRIVHIMWTARWSEADQLRVGVARDVSERKRAESMQAALYAITDAANQAEDLPSLFEQIHQIVGRFLPAQNFSVALYDDAQDKLSFPYYVNETEQTQDIRQADSAILCAEVVRSGQPLFLTPETRINLPAHIQLESGTEASHWLGVPLRAQSRTVGTLVVHGQAEKVLFTQQDIELLQFVSSQVANAIERKRADERLRHMAWHDPLTDLPNRELFHDRLQSAMLRAQRYNTPLCVLYLDLDNFKEVNDTLGHTVGDLLLQEAARRLRECVRESDTVGRIGGDEFMVLLNGLHEPDHALIVAEKLRLALAEPYELAGQQVTIGPSIGIALYPDHGEDFRQLIHFADEAMYEAKKRGGNQLCVSSARR